jgi:hypothetical protein
MLDIGAGDPDVAQHAFVETRKVQPIPVPAVPNEKRVYRRAQNEIECVHDAGKRVSGLRAAWCGKRLAGNIVIQRRNSIARRSGFTVSAKEMVQCDTEFNRRIFHMYR